MFSIVLPTHNRASLLKRAIESVRAQSCDAWELVVVDDGSTDGTAEVVREFADSRITYLWQSNQERSAARNTGVRRARGEYVCFLDSDDYYLPAHLAALRDAIAAAGHPRAMFATAYIVESESGRRVVPPPDTSSAHPVPAILRAMTVVPSSVCVHRSCLGEAPFLERYRRSYWEDTHLWLRLAAAHPFHALTQPTVVQVEHASRSVNSVVTLERVNDHIAIIQHLFGEHGALLAPHLGPDDRIDYLQRRYRMFTYQARIAGQLGLAWRLLARAAANRRTAGDLGYFAVTAAKLALAGLGVRVR